MTQLVRRAHDTGINVSDPEHLLTREWLVTNGLGGYASGTLAGVVTRRYHGLLIAALPAPFGRMVMLSELVEQLKGPDGKLYQLGGDERVLTEGTRPSYVSDFRLEMGLPVWEFQVNGIRLERRLLLLHLQNTVHVTYRLLDGPDSIWMRLRPVMNFRSHDDSVSIPLRSYEFRAKNEHYEISAGETLPCLSLTMSGIPFTVDSGVMQKVVYPIEESRGYEFRGELWYPGYFDAEIKRTGSVTFVASTESWDIATALPPDEAQASEIRRRRRLLLSAGPTLEKQPSAELVLAADQFIITPIGRPLDNARAHAAGDEVRTVIAGYHWFTDWGRDTMISLEGLTLTAGRFKEAEWILRTFAYYIRNGLIPNMFPEGEHQGLYHTADATLWFFHAIQRYIDVTQDRAILMTMLPRCLDIFEQHMRGTKFNICVDAKDGLLHQGQEGYQLTWMDAKVDGWVVTPRRGKAVEINALWYNALRILEAWLGEEKSEAAATPIRDAADRVQESFNKRFWFEEGGYLYDVVDAEGGGNDSACRPNQVFAISLDHPVLERDRWVPVIKVVREQLLTPVGLRSLAPGHPDYKQHYFGDLKTRDAAYHQGTVWAWLIGPYIDAWLKIYPDDRAGARQLLDGCVRELGDTCIGSISEVFDAEAPFAGRGCIAQAWSVAEVLRCWKKTEEKPRAT